MKWFVQNKNCSLWWKFSFCEECHQLQEVELEESMPFDGVWRSQPCSWFYNATLGPVSTCWFLWYCWNHRGMWWPSSKVSMAHGLHLWASHSSSFSASLATLTSHSVFMCSWLSHLHKSLQCGARLGELYHHSCVPDLLPINILRPLEALPMDSRDQLSWIHFQFWSYWWGVEHFSCCKSCKILCIQWTIMRKSLLFLDHSYLIPNALARWKQIPLTFYKFIFSQTYTQKRIRISYLSDLDSVFIKFGKLHSPKNYKGIVHP